MSTVKPTNIQPNKPDPTTAPSKSDPTAGTNTFLIGEVGTGKTTSLPTFIRAGIDNGVDLKLAVIITDPGGEEALMDGMEIHAPRGKKSLPMENLHYRYIPPTGEDWKSLIDMATRVNKMGYAELAGLKSGISTSKHTGFIDLLQLLANFKDQNDEEFGPVDHFDSTWMIAIDGLTGINDLAKQLHVGLKPSLHQGEWGVAMATEEVLVNKIIASTKCFTCIIAHVERVYDEVVGTTQFYPAFLGNKLAPKAPRIFSDVITTDRDGEKFYWSTAKRNYSSLKARNLRIGEKLQPDFGQIYKTWLNRQKRLEA